MEAAVDARSALDRHRTVAVGLLLVAAVFGTVLGEPDLPMQVAVLVAGVVLVGTPHGGLDHRAGREVLTPSFGAAWPLPFAGAYIGAAAAMVALWCALPVVGLALFLALSWAHFGEANSHGAWLVVERFARGGIPIVAPALAHPGDIDMIFGWMAGTDGAALATILRGPAAWAWVPALVAYLTRTALTRASASLESAALTAVAVALSPLLSFTLFFCLVHAPRAMIEAGRETGESPLHLLRNAAPLSFAAAAMAAAGYTLLVDGATPEVAAVRTVFIWLAALTVPHMLLTSIAARARQGRGRP